MKKDISIEEEKWLEMITRYKEKIESASESLANRAAIPTNRVKGVRPTKIPLKFRRPRSATPMAIFMEKWTRPRD